jgi:hypothetical protein
MAKSKTIPAPQDHSRIKLHQDYEIHYWTEKLGVSKEQLQDAVNKVGTSPGAVANELKRVTPTHACGSPRPSLRF